MNILIISQYFYPEDFRINDVARGLVERGHEVTVITGIPNYPGGSFFAGYGLFRKLRQTWNGIRILRVPLVPRGRGGGLRLALNYLSWAALATVLAPLLRPRWADIVLVFEVSPVTVGVPAVVLKKLTGVPVLFWVLDLWPESLAATGAVRSQRVLRMVSGLVRWIYDNCDRILISSQAFAGKIRQQFEVPEEKLLYFPQAAEDFYRLIDLEGDAPERELVPSGFNVMFAGNLGAAQDLPTVIEAAELLKGFPDVHFIVLGDGRLREWTEGEVRKRGLTGKVRLLGRYPAASMPRFFALADVLLVTLKKDPLFALSVPAKLQSYFACGKPVVAALDGEGARIVEEAGAGLACPSGDPRALADRVLELYRMPSEVRASLGQAGRSYFEATFERNTLLGKLECWMRELA